MDTNRARAACKEKIGGCMSGCAGKREQKGVRDCRGGLIGVSVVTPHSAVAASRHSSLAFPFPLPPTPAPAPAQENGQEDLKKAQVFLAILCCVYSKRFSCY